jgi:endo-1,4-beta-xylanase
VEQFQVAFDELRAAIVAYNALGLKVMITELDLDVVERPGCGADVSLHHAYQPEDDVFAARCPAAVLERQAEQYARLFEIFTDPELDVQRVTFWGLEDGLSWLNTWPGKRTNHPLLFDRDCRAKPALDAVLTVARRRRREAARDEAVREGAGQP